MHIIGAVPEERGSVMNLGDSISFGSLVAWSLGLMVSMLLCSFCTGYYLRQGAFLPCNRRSECESTIDRKSVV